MENDGGLDVLVVQAEHDALQLFQSEADELTPAAIPPAASTPIPPAPSTPIPPVATWRHAHLSPGFGRRITFGFGCGVLVGALMMQSLATPRANTRSTSRPPAMPAPASAPAQTVAAPVATTLAAETVKADAAPQPPPARPVAVPAAVAAAMPAAAPGYRGEFRITSSPSGATVFVNNERVGRTPFASSALRVGSRAVRLELDGHIAWSRSVQIVANRVASVSARLEVARRQQADQTLPDSTEDASFP